jgi:protein-S-isoprenylcysteine O-methyltransferase Ste14
MNLGALLAGITIFLGGPLLGWGFTDLRGFLGDPVRLSYVVAMVVLQVGVVVLIPDVGRSRGRQKPDSERSPGFLPLLQLIPLLVLILGPFFDRRAIWVIPGDVAVRLSGLALLVGGFVLMHWAEVALGRQFAVEIRVHEGHQLVTTGLYRWIRHPRYAGVLMLVAGISGVFRSWVAVLLTVAFAFVLVLRLRREEALLHREFGAEWEEYAERSWRLIPLLY